MGPFHAPKRKQAPHERHVSDCLAQKGGRGPDMPLVFEQVLLQYPVIMLNNSPPAVISGMFRSGTTHLWRLLSADPAFSESYCEPLHPSLKTEMQTLEHYRNYQQRKELVDRAWSPKFSSDRLLLDATESYPELEHYLRDLLRPGSLVKCVRMCLRLGWFARLFPEACIIHLVRDPRAVCYSMLRHPGAEDLVRRDLSWGAWHAREYFEAYAKLKPFREYLKSLRSCPPYIKILGLWRINVERSLMDLEGHARHSVLMRCEDVCQTTEAQLSLLYQHLGRPLPREVLQASSDSSQKERKWQQATSKEWLYQYRQVDDQIWQAAIDQAQIAPLMARLKYS